MKQASPARQRGLSFLGMLFFGGIIAFLGVVGAKAVPAYLEYFAIQKAVNKASGENSVAEVRRSFDNAAAIDNISEIRGQDLEVSKEGDRVVVRFAYDKQIHLGGHAYLLLKYSGRSR